MDGHLAVEAQIESVRMQLLFFSKTWSLVRVLLTANVRRFDGISQDIS
jgi:hypothetical protein